MIADRCHQECPLTFFPRTMFIIEMCVSRFRTSAVPTHPSPKSAWKFLSVHILEKPEWRRTILDDIESIYWLLLYCALHWLPHNRPHFNMSLFDESTVEHRSGPGMLPSIVVGGSKKERSLTHCHFKSLTFDSGPLNDLLKQFAALLRRSYSAEWVDFEAVRVDASVAMEKLGDVDFMVKMFDDALGREDWPKDDRVQDQFPPKTEGEKRREAEEARLLRLLTAEGRPYR